MSAPQHNILHSFPSSSSSFSLFEDVHSCRKKAHRVSTEFCKWEGLVKVHTSYIDGRLLVVGLFSKGQRSAFISGTGRRAWDETRKNRYARQPSNGEADWPI